MNIRVTNRRVSAVFAGLFVALSAVLLAMPSLAKASTYGSGNFGGCKYQDGCPVASTSNTGSQTANSTSSVTADGTTTILINGYSEFFTETGKTLTDLEVGDVIEFCIGASTIYQACDSTKDTHHAATVKSIDLDAGSVVLTIGAALGDFTLVLSSAKKLDIDGDSVDDIEITLTALTATTANITFKNLVDTTIATSTPPTSSVDTTEETEAESPSRSWLWWLLGIIGGLLLLWILIAILRRSDDDNNSSFGSGSSSESSSGKGKSSDTSSSNFTASYTPDSHIPMIPTVVSPTNLLSENNNLTQLAYKGE